MKNQVYTDDHTVGRYRSVF